MVSRQLCCCQEVTEGAQKIESRPDGSRCPGFLPTFVSPHFDRLKDLEKNMQARTSPSRRDTL